jgi:hypothetical protein
MTMVGLCDLDRGRDLRDFACPTSETPAARVHERKAITLRGEGIAAEFKKVVEDYIEQRFGGEKSAAYGRN